MRAPTGRMWGRRCVCASCGWLPRMLVLSLALQCQECGRKTPPNPSPQFVGTCVCELCVPIRPLPLFAFMRLSWHRQHPQRAGGRTGAADAACSCLSLIMFGRGAIFALSRTYLCASPACQAATRAPKRGAEFSRSTG